MGKIEGKVTVLYVFDAPGELFYMLLMSLVYWVGVEVQMMKGVSSTYPSRREKMESILEPCP
jgi:hypothetical protein